MENKRKLVGDLVHGYTYVDAADYEAKREAAMKEVERKRNDLMDAITYAARRQAGLPMVNVDVSSLHPKFMGADFDGDVVSYCAADVVATKAAYDQINHRKEHYIKERDMNRIKKVIFNDPATIVYWSDGTKTVVKAEGEPFDPEKGLAMAIAKYFFNNKGYYYEVFKKWLPKEEKAKAQCELRETYLSVRDLAIKNGVSESTIRKQINAGKYPNAKKINGVWWVTYSEV